MLLLHPVTWRRLISSFFSPEPRRGGNEPESFFLRTAPDVGRFVFGEGNMKRQDSCQMQKELQDSLASQLPCRRAWSQKLPNTILLSLIVDPAKENWWFCDEENLLHFQSCLLRLAL
ncbi:hypothetical protein RP20_CCG022828 [Aedes albopictus]|nr:hypothetical protein RP20_CCG022828 [Aedes albopictus]